MIENHKSEEQNVQPKMVVEKDDRCPVPRKYCWADGVIPCEWYNIDEFTCSKEEDSDEK